MKLTISHILSPTYENGPILGQKGITIQNASKDPNDLDPDLRAKIGPNSCLGIGLQNLPEPIQNLSILANMGQEMSEIG